MTTELRPPANFVTLRFSRRLWIFLAAIPILLVMSFAIALPEWRPYLLESAVGIVLLFISATLFFLIVFGTVLLPGRKPATPVEMPVAELYNNEPAPAWLDSWWPWVNGAIALIIIRYGPMIYQRIRDYQSIPFVPRIW